MKISVSNFDNTFQDHLLLWLL